MYLLVANGDPPSPSFLALRAKGKTLVAVDGGLAACEKAALTPELIMGDFDSAPPALLEKYRHIPQMVTPDPNFSDLEKALAYLFPQTQEPLIVCGALGKRTDHALTNIYLLCRYPGKIKFESEQEVCYALHPKSELTCLKGQTLSLIPLSTQVTDVTTQGLKWELKHATLNKNCMSLSNVCMQEKIAITFKEGDLIVCLKTS